MRPIKTRATIGDPVQINWLDQESAAISAGFPENMVLLDCETTGGNATRHRIIEIGVIVIEKGQVIDEWQTFCDPGTSIPQNIQQLTGIRPDMLTGAPEFSAIAQRLLEFLDQRTLVAHNARFDYGFLKNEFRRAGISFSTKPLCSVKFSRTLYPQFRRHGLSDIIKRFDLNIKNRHRALDDAWMIYGFFRSSSELFAEDEIAAICKILLSNPALPPLLPASEIDKLPNSAGVYYFHNEAGELLYIGKSVHIRNRVRSHFTQDHSNPKDMQMSAKVSAVKFQKTPSDFGAQLYESQQIKTLNPLYNRRLRRVKKLFHFRRFEDHHGYHRLKIEALSDCTSESVTGLFRSPRQAVKKLEQLADEHLLCHQLLNLEKTSGGMPQRPCFRSQLQKCLGACCGAEPTANYNQRLALALADYEIKIWPWSSAILVEERDPTDPEHCAFHLVDQWCYLTQLDDLNHLYDAGYQPQNAVFSDCNRSLSKALEPLHIPMEAFDLDTYLILVRFLLNAHRRALNNLKVWPLQPATHPSD